MNQLVNRSIRSAVVAAAALLVASPAVLAQSAADPKIEWATKVVALQQGPELERLVKQLAQGASQELIANWGPKLDANVPKAKLKKATEDLNVELGKYTEDTGGLITKQVSKVSADVLVPAYAERFSVEELKQLAAFFDSPAVKKYQASAPELGNTFIKKLIEASRPDVAARSKQFDEAASKIVGVAPGATPAESGKAKPKK